MGKYKATVLIGFLMFLVSSLGANQFEALWEDPRVVQNRWHEIAVPRSWQDLAMINRGQERNFSIVDAGLPSNFNGRSVIANFSVVFEANLNKTQAVDAVMRNFVRATGRQVEQVEFAANNWQGTLIKSFNPPLNGRHGQRYDLIVNLPERGGSYVFSIFIQFSDASGEFVERFNLDDFAETVFNHIWLL